MILLSMLTASALEPEVGLQVNAGVANTDETPLLFGLGGQLAIDPWRRLHLEIGGDAGVTTTGNVWAGGGPRVRFFAGPPEKTVLNFFLGGGVAGGARGVQPLVEGGTALDLLKSDGLRPRLQARVAWEPRSAIRVLLSVGVVFGRKAPIVSEPAPLAVPTPAPIEPVPAPQPGRPTFAGEGMIWVPGPVCQWLPGDEALAEIDELGMVMESLSAIGPRSLGDPDADPTLPPPEPKVGRIAIAASPSDRVSIDREVHPVDGGLLVVDHPDGRAEVVIEGGGRRQVFTLGVARDNVVWVDGGDAEPTRVLFDVGGAALDAEARNTIQAFAAHLGDWRVELFGSYSPEGDVTANRELAQRRAEAVHAELIAAGIPTGHILFGPVQPPAAGLDPAEMRNATLQPVEGR